jgi:uncharacterized protein YndB with AHSA1/START domain
MARTEARTGRSVRIARTFEAPRERLFRAFSEKEAVKVWFAAPSNLFWLQEPELDLRPGGRYRFTVGDGTKVWSIHGSYLEVEPPSRLSFTWLWENDPTRGDSGDTVVTVELFDRGGRTEVVLTHEGFASELVQGEHDQGWEECLDAIGTLLQPTNL